ncbi:helicase-related protein [Kaistella carnis]|uniref:helicase-related protein n=2 Tax=Kaistella TaxID=2782231 RepID=UPI0028A705F8|nr:helicase-related protein [Kaistella carnis]
MREDSFYYSNSEIETISKSLSILDYFLHLEKRGELNFDRKIGREYYFKTDHNKFSVSDNGYYDFKTGEGGQIIKAVMEFENVDWRNALEFVKNFNQNFMLYDNSIRNEQTNLLKDESKSATIHITNSLIPSNEKLISYFEGRGISKQILVDHTKQIHYEFAGKNYFGIGIENISGGFEIRNSLMKSKVGKNNISEIIGEKNEVVVFEGMTDMLSFAQLLKVNNQKNNRTLITLNSITNLDKFLNKYSDYKGKIFLCLDGDKAGNEATVKILNSFINNSVKDIRALYNISENEHNDLNEYLQHKLELQNKNVNLVEPNTVENENFKIQSTGNSSGEFSKTLESEQKRDIASGQKLGSENAGNGSPESKRINLTGRRIAKSIRSAQQENASENESGEIILDGKIIKTSAELIELNNLIEKYKGQKLTNEQVAEVVSAACFVSETGKIIIRENVIITDDLKDICNQFKSGGTAKEGRGILDEYYTDSKIVDAVRNLISDQFKYKKEISVLEPSVGTGNFINASAGLGIKSDVKGFEINPTTAKIAKIFHPEAEINLRSFETEFIDDHGNKRSSNDYSNKYDLVIGNPPYGEHRGFYKGLGEESKISKYEDYFIKRGLDSLKQDGILAMVVPSGWLNRHEKLNNAELLSAYRLPSGAFAGTQIGTDIIILKKNSQSINQNISDYFDNNPQNILGEIREKTNRFGRLEFYVHGNLDDAIVLLSNLRNRKETVRIGNLFEDLEINEHGFDKIVPLKITISESSQKDIRQKSKIENETLRKSVLEKLEKVLLILNFVKFKSPSIFAQIEKFAKSKGQISDKPENFSNAKLNDLSEKVNKVLQSQNNKNSEYEIQSQPLIKKGVLKYQFAKEDRIVDASLQNSSDITEEQIAAFKATSYDGTIHNHSRHFAYANYQDGKYVHDFYYAEGNIYEKLDQLEKDFKEDWGILGLEKKYYEKQKALLLNVLPKLKTLEEISINPNHEFVYQFKLGTIEKEQYNHEKRETETVIVKYNLAEKFKDFVSNLPSEAFAGSSSWEVRSFVDNETVTGSDKERNALIRERRKTAANDLFSKFIREELSDDLRDRFVKEFNKNYNHIHVPDYSKFPLFSKIYQNFKGTELRLTEVQKSGIGRQTTKGVGLLAHEVGFGKTLSGILSLHEAMHRGNSKKPLIVVPNDSILKQWVETIFETIPSVKVNVLGNLGKDYDLSKFDNKEGEITIVTYEGFNNIGFSNEITEKLSSRFNYISANELQSVTNTERDLQIELQKEKEIEGKMKRGKIYDWEDFGFDHLTYDEVHNANHIVGKVKIEDRRFASDFRHQNQQTSKLGINTWMAAQYIQDRQNGRNVTLLSATPFTNKPLEYYSILSLIANKRLEESGYFNVNNFFETFMEADNDMEIDAKGDVKFKPNVRRFKNNQLFQQLLSEFIDIKGEEDNLELIRPTKINKEYKIEQNDLMTEQYELLNQNFNETEKGAILTHILNARLIAFSPYLSIYYEGEDPTLNEFIENSPKLKETMNLIRQNKNDLPDSGQIIYSELAVAQFPKLKEYLIKELNYNPEEVGIITGSTPKKQRVTIQDNFNSGKIKIIIGSEAIQEGMNLQENTTDVYLLTLPYNFTSLRQVEGRAWRQGNKNENVRINFMLTNDSIDVFMLQKLQSKQARYLEAMKRGADVLDISDISTQELKTSIITNPETRAKIEIELLKKKLESEKNKFLADSAFVLRKYEEFTKVQSEVHKAEYAYHRILEYSKNSEDVNADYWETQLTSYQKSIDLAKVEVHNTILKLSEKGVNVTEIEKQSQATAENISKIDEKLEELPFIETNLIEQYKEEKKARLKLNVKTDHVKDREEENRKLFKHVLFAAINDKHRVVAIKYSESKTENRKFAGRR